MKSICFALIVLYALSASVTKGNESPKIKRTHLYVSQYENVLGTSMEIKVSASSQQEASRAETAALTEISRLSKILSAYDPDSEFSHWLKTSGQAIPVSKELFEVLSLFDEWRKKTNGALDASAEVITRLWKLAAVKQELPSQEELQHALREVAQVHWKLDAATQTAIHLTNTPLMLNSFAKSYIIRHAAEVAKASGNIDAVIVNIGGDLVALGQVKENVMISDPKADAENDLPLDQILITNKAVATSGNYRRGEQIKGHWYSHIVDPRTGMPAENIISATVVAENATDAGAMATTFSVLAPSESQRLASGMPGVEWLLITRSGEQIKSPGWDKLEIPRQKKAEQPVIGKSSVSQDFELMINLEINLQKEGFAKRPYVAVWVEDSTHSPLRTIAVWHGNERYLPELKSWYLKNRNQYNSDRNFNSSISSATRSAGKYTLKWDGKDDKGNFVNPGKYTIKIEVSREHGTYQLMRQEINWDENPKKFNLSGNIEIASASLDYKKKTSGN
jgi:thiamine biosynthesis lipoprotein ApbE